MYLSTEQLLAKIKSGAPIVIGVDVKDAVEFGLAMDLYNEGIRKKMDKDMDSNIEYLTKSLIRMGTTSYFIPKAKPTT